MATIPRGLLDRWLTINNQGNDSSTGEGDGNGPTTDWGKLLNLDFDQMRRLGYMGNMPAQNSTDGGDQQGNPMQEAQDWMRQSGYSYGINPTMNGGQWNTWLDPQGNEVEGTRREFAAPNDNGFWAAANLAGGLVGGPMLAQGLGSQAAAGAVLGGMGGFGQDMDLKDGLKGAAIGGLGGAAMDYFSGFQPMPETGLSPMEFNPDDLFQGMADPTNALQQLPELGQLPGAMPSMTPSGLGSIPTGQFPQLDPGMFTQGLPSLPEVPTLPWQQLPYEQTVEIPGSRVTPDATGRLASTLPAAPAALDPIAPMGAGAAASVTAGLPSLPAVPAAIGGGLLSSLPPGVKTAIEVGLPIAGAIAGSQPSGGGTTTRESKTDPRFDPYLYGDGGFLPSAKSWFDANKSGANDTMRAGWNQQLGLLNDPQIAQQLTGMRNQGLLASQGPVAGNPFVTGQMQLPSGGQGLLSGMQYPRMPDRRSMG